MLLRSTAQLLKQAHLTNACPQDAIALANLRHLQVDLPLDGNLAILIQRIMRQVHHSIGSLTDHFDQIVPLVQQGRTSLMLLNLCDAFHYYLISNIVIKKDNY